ncbi:hypothetical protein [uncultured Kordia sp.]|uniref:hypothetical protein n=1 Tax=uncultured Kordia sp. TaxID=507699 RepID=UPI002616F802|nr:hypothetical protein [uncultured Kordia sp.]
MQKEINTENSTLYTKRAIGIATFIGGPIAAGYLIRENYNELQEESKGNNILIISIVATIALFVLIFSIPESFINKIPNVVIPAIYTALITFWVEHTFGSIFKQHEENKYSFYSVWRAVGIGVVSLLIMLVGIFGYVYFSTDVEAENLYADKIRQFSKNEHESLKFFNHIDSESDFGLILELNKKVIPIWKENIEIIQQANTIKNLPSVLMEQNKKLLRYCELRIESFELLKKALSENTSKYDSQLEFVNAQIEKQLELINE